MLSYFHFSISLVVVFSKKTNLSVQGLEVGKLESREKVFSESSPLGKLGVD